MKRHAETLKVKYGSALASETMDNEVVCIPGIRGKEPKEISLKNLASIIQARMEEIIDHVHYEIKNSGYDKKLIGGIVVTGGGAQLKHLTQLFEYMTGMDTRIGYPTEHLSSANTIDNLTSPMYSTGIGLVMKGFEEVKRKNRSLSSSTEQGKTEEKSTKKEKKVNQGTEGAKRGSFFQTILKRAEDFLKEEE
jgi:cell division protein FtsA